MVKTGSFLYGKIVIYKATDKNYYMEIDNKAETLIKFTKYQVKKLKLEEKFENDRN